MRSLKLTLLVSTIAILATSLPAHAQQSSPDLLGAGVSFVNNLLNPPHRAAEIAADAEIRKAKIAADAEVEKEKLRIEASKTTDKVSPLLSEWGVSRVNCTPDSVFINGITSDTVCVQPSPSMTSGYYTYHSDKKQLIRTSGNAPVKSAQSTPISAPSSNPRPGKGF